MSQSNLDPKVSALLAAGAADWTDSEPNTGQGVQGEWPPEGDHDLLILKVTDKVGVFNDADRKVDCIEVQFHYEWLRDSKDPTFDPSKPPLTFMGERFQLVPNAKNVVKDEGALTRARINWDRFSGHVSKILQVSKEGVSDALSAFSKVKEAVGTNKVAVSARIEYRPYKTKKGKDGTARTEYITGRLA